MRYQQPNILSSSTICSSRGRQKSSLPMSVVAVMCLLAGYLWGRHHTPDPYPVDMAAYLPPPPKSQQQQQQQQRQSSATTTSSSSSSSTPSQPAAAPSHPALSSPLDTFSAQYISQSGLLSTRPPVTPGRSGSSKYTVVPHQVISWYPRIILFPNFLDEATTDYIKQLAEPRLEQSSLGVGSVPTETHGQDVRTSMGAFLSRGDDPAGVLAAVEEKIAAVSYIPPSHGEDFNVLRYQTGQHYHMHMDTFDSSVIRRLDPAFGQRMATMIMYLNDVAEGGETVFKREGRYGAASALSRSEDDLVGCSPGDFKLKPRRGDAVLFFSLTPDLSVDPRALHGACPVGAGSEKWVMTKWMHDKPVTHWDGEEAVPH